MSGGINQAVDQIGEQTIVMESPGAASIFRNEMNRSQDELLNFGNVINTQIYKNSFVNSLEQRAELKKLFQKMSDNKKILAFTESKRILHGGDS